MIYETSSRFDHAHRTLELTMKASPEDARFLERLQRLATAEEENARLKHSQVHDATQIRDLRERLNICGGKLQETLTERDALRKENANLRTAIKAPAKITVWDIGDVKGTQELIRQIRAEEQRKQDKLVEDLRQQIQTIDCQRKTAIFQRDNATEALNRVCQHNQELQRQVGTGPFRTAKAQESFALHCVDADNGMTLGVWDKRDVETLKEAIRLTREDEKQAQRNRVNGLQDLTNKLLHDVQQKDDTIDCMRTAWVSTAAKWDAERECYKQTVKYAADTAARWCTLCAEHEKTISGLRKVQGERDEARHKFKELTRTCQARYDSARVEERRRCAQEVRYAAVFTMGQLDVPAIQGALADNLLSRMPNKEQSCTCGA